MSDRPTGSHTSAPARVVIVDLGRQTATGARRRLSGLERVFTAIGFEVCVIELLPGFRSGALAALARLPRSIRSAKVVPETLAWSPRRVRGELDRLSPAIVICVTDRCFHPDLLGPWETYIDFVDRLSVSYADRTRLAGSVLKRLEYRLLRGPHVRFETGFAEWVDGGFAAGRADSISLGVHWVPIDGVADPRTLETLRDSSEMDTDLAFVGTLDYPPNEMAIFELDALWPELSRVRPGISLLVAGARPTSRVREIVRRNGWELVADFASAGEIYRRSRIAVAPLHHASGLQIKVLDAAANAVPQLVSPVVASGLDAEFPMVVCRTRDCWVAEIVRLLDDPNGALLLGELSRRHLERQYGLDAVVSHARLALHLNGDGA